MKEPTSTMIAAAPRAAGAARALGVALFVSNAVLAQVQGGANEPSAVAVERFEAALAATPDDLGAHHDLLHALHFRGSFPELGEEARKDVYSRATEVSSSAMTLLHGPEELKWKRVDEIVEEGRAQAEGGPLHYWAAVIWGSWGDLHGPMPALRQGVADRLRLHGQVALEIAPDYDSAGPYRFLGRMHAIAPKVPMFTGWIDRQTGVELLEEAYRRAPEHPHNRLFLAEIWLDRRPEKKEEALALLDELLQAEPRPGHETEDRRALEEARASAQALEE